MRYHSIAISGLPGAGKSSLANLLSRTLKWPVKSIGEIWRERHKSQNITIPFEVYWRNSSITDNKKINEEFLELVSKGNVIADTRYAHIYSDRTFKVFVTAPIAIRALRAHAGSKYPNHNCENIEQILDIREKDELLMGEKLYGMGYDYKDPKQYNLVLDSSKMIVEQEYHEILNKMKF